jgi:hypothetical protein
VVARTDRLPQIRNQFVEIIAARVERFSPEDDLAKIPLLSELYFEFGLPCDVRGLGFRCTAARA